MSTRQAAPVQANSRAFAPSAVRPRGSLTTLDLDRRLRPVRPAEDVPEVVAQAEELLHRLRRLTGHPPADIELTGGAAADDAAAELIAAAESSVMLVAATPEGHVDGETSLFGSLYDAARRHRTVRTVVRPDQVGCPAARRPFEQLERAGGRVRVTQGSGDLLILAVDRSNVLVRQPDRRRDGEAVVVRGTALLDSLLRLADSQWDRAQDLARLPAGPAHEQFGQTGESRATVLGYLAAGVKDETAAREMAVSLRTYRRYVATLMAELNATSRFQAGAIAAQRGWLVERSTAAG
jgi:hypothetical protein